MDTIKTKRLVVDTAPLLKRSPIRGLAEEFFTVPEVIAEMRDSSAREYLTQLPFELKVRHPTEEAMRAVAEFSKKTGDFPALSLPDLRVLALVYTLEKEAKGTVAHIKTAPSVPRTVGMTSTLVNIKPAPTPAVSVDDLAEKVDASLTLEETAEEEEGEAEHEADQTVYFDAEEVSPEDEAAEEFVSVEKTEMTTEPEETSAETEAEAETPTGSLPGWDEINNDGNDDGVGQWITPSNVQRHKARAYGQANGEDAEEVAEAACVTADFAMQNVLLQMGLRLLSVDGIIVKKIKTSVLRCHACFKVTTKMDKKFCPSCGGPTLSRVSAQVDRKGNLRVFLKANYTHNVRGTRYSLPKPRGGREGEKLILREDQKEYQRGIAKFRRRKEGLDVFDPDFIPSMLIGRGKNPLQEEPIFGYGRKNPNHSRKNVNKKKNRD